MAFDLSASHDDLFDDPFGSDDAHRSAASAPAHDREAQRALAAALAHGETGVPMAALLQLALPLVALYGLDAADVRAVAEQPDAAPADAIAVLEVTRLLWAFLSLPEQEQAAAIGPLLDHLGGAEPDADGWEVVHELIETTQPAWDALGGVAGARAIAPEALSFDALLRHPAFSDHQHEAPADHAAITFGPNRLGEVEARALFAEPLLSDPAVLTDPDAFEGALARADVYWDIASAPNRERGLAAFVRQQSHSPADTERLQREGIEMLIRFDQLFSEQVEHGARD